VQSFYAVKVNKDSTSAVTVFSLQNFADTAFLVNNRAIYVREI